MTRKKYHLNILSIH